MSKDDAQFEKAKDERTNIQTELFLAIRSVYARLLYPLGDPSTGDSKLTDTTLLDSYTEQPGGQPIKYDGKDNATKGELGRRSNSQAIVKFQVRQRRDRHGQGQSLSIHSDYVSNNSCSRRRVGHHGTKFSMPPAAADSWSGPNLELTRPDEGCPPHRWRMARPGWPGAEASVRRTHCR